jgi:hypothetical protein
MNTRASRTGYRPMRANGCMRHTSPHVRVDLALLCQCSKQNCQCCDEERDGNPKQKFGYDLNHRAAASCIVGVHIAVKAQLRCNPSTGTDRRPTKLIGKLSRQSYRAMSELFRLQSQQPNLPVGVWANVALIASSWAAR